MSAATDAGAVRSPGIARRLACAVYEGILLFGVVMMAGYLYSSLTQQRHALQGTVGLQAFVFLVLGIYFVWFWSHGGQTVAMKTWRIRVVAADDRPPSEKRALARYLCSWLWFIPPLAVARWSGVQSSVAIAAILFSGTLLYVMLARFLPGRQYLHDLICRTRLVTWAATRTRQEGDR